MKTRQRLLAVIPPLEECYRPVFMLQYIDFLGKHCRAELKYFSCSVKWFIVFAIYAQSSNILGSTSKIVNFARIDSPATSEYLKKFWWQSLNSHSKLSNAFSSTTQEVSQC